MTVEERLRPAATLKPEVASLNMGSMNFGLYPMLNRFKDFKFEWERQHLENSRDLVFKNTFADIEYILKTCSENGTRFEFECYDTSHLYNLAHFRDRGLVKGPLFVQTVFGLLGGIGPHPEDVMHMKRTADRLFGDDYRWSVLGAGRNQMPIAAMAAAMGANVRVGLEDSLWDGPGKLAESNAVQVRRVRSILEGLGLEIATACRGAGDPGPEGRRSGRVLISDRNRQGGELTPPWRYLSLPLLARVTLGVLLFGQILDLLADLLVRLLVGIDLDRHGRRAVVDHVELLGGTLRHVQDPVFRIGAAVVDLDIDRLAGFLIGDRRLRAERQLLGGGGHFVLVEDLAVGGLLAVEITAVVRGFALDDQRVVIGFAGWFLRQGGSQYQ